MNPQLLNAQGLDAQMVQQVAEKLRKDITVSGITGLAMYRQDLSPVLAIEPPIDTPLRNRFSRQPGNGGAHEWNRLVTTVNSDGSPLIGGTTPAGAAFAKGGLPVNVNPVYEHVSAPYKLIGDIAEVTDFDQEAGRTYIDMMAHQIKMKTLNVALIEEWMILNGNSSVNPLYFDGLTKQCTFNGVDAGNAQFKLGNMRSGQKLMFDQGAQPRLAVMSTNIKAKVNDLILANYYGIRQTTGLTGFAMLSAGLNVDKFNVGFGEVELIQHRFLRPTSYSGGGTETVIMLDHMSYDDNGNNIAMVDLLPVAMTPLARTTTSTRRLVQEYTLLKVTIPLYQSIVTDIATPTFQS